MAENRGEQNRNAAADNDLDLDDAVGYMQLMYEQAAESDTVQRVRQALSETADTARKFAGRVADAMPGGDRAEP
ncbi:MAG TPA: hypothetical protein VK464_02755 [Symbiobacteriaceae bacterium]|jgi:hypothetical protein|nr:hypothetical protein [Symbiobacteriaceae bacterium]